MSNSSAPLRWGLVSTANINRAMIDPIRRAERSQLTAVASRDLGKARAYAEAWSIPKAFGSYEVKCKLGYEVSGTVHVIVTEEK